MIDGIVGPGNAAATRWTTTLITFTGNNTPNIAVPIFGIDGIVRVVRIWGRVNTILGANHTGAYFRLNDGTGTYLITLDTGGATLSGFKAGSRILRASLAAVVALVTDAVIGSVIEPAAAGGKVASEFEVIKKYNASTNIEYVYSTTDTPTSGAIRFNLEWQPVSINSNVTPLGAP